MLKKSDLNDFSKDGKKPERDAIDIIIIICRYAGLVSAILTAYFASVKEKLSIPLVLLTFALLLAPAVLGMIPSKIQTDDGEKLDKKHW